MATDVDVQYFSHLNGLTLGNNWGDLIRLLDKALVTGIDFTQITDASIDAQGDVHITLYAAHNAMLFQVVELTGFAPASFNQKYRIKGVPNTTQLILKPHAAITETSITTIGAGKLAPLGYEIIFRDLGDVKRVYRAKNPTAQHPFIRVDESLTSPDGTTGVYTSTYAKFAMVGLLEHMDHIDDYEDPNVLQLPFNPADPAKNWKISGAESTVTRGWSKWYWRRGNGFLNNAAESVVNTSTNLGAFTIVGDQDKFYFQHTPTPDTTFYKVLNGCGLYQTALVDSVIPNWFLMTTMLDVNASVYQPFNNISNGTPLAGIQSGFFTTKQAPLIKLSEHALAFPFMPDNKSGKGSFNSNNIAALEIPFRDSDNYIRGTLETVAYSGNIKNTDLYTTPLISENSMYVWDSAYVDAGQGGFYFYLGELE
ncbi:hypothetical protein [Acinetobacter indicus]|uniref:hypothetical protein n=1 Tax=Acinetobacter indicus TaxID=756892 RepID=UPI00148D577A|nr:hypothetical protein [Acinetobacter indicus]NOJ67241.1 hypothetical protein [Acinetobacter indicus]